MIDQETRERLERAKKLLDRAPTKTTASPEALEEFREWREQQPDYWRP